jgi:hypothetical protein
MKETTEHILKLGEAANIQSGVFQANIKVIFAGMVSDSVYSIVVRWSAGNNSLAYNLYFTDRQREIILPKGKITVINVGRDQLIFKHGN